MKKKIIFFCYIAVTGLLVLPSISAISTSTEQGFVQDAVTSMQIQGEQESLDSPLFTGYLLFQVLTYTPGIGIRPYAGANITVKGFFYSYSGQTDESGDCLFKVHTNLIRMKKYFIKVSIPPGDWLHTKRISLLLEPREIYYKDFLFIVL
ncbi:MAG: hypothetical protein JW840_05460 [Candidatus Thermoplasmatota archaeon]|nr:hypothetical protein [Candidatus Thermoplasmatota archaeon]